MYSNYTQKRHYFLAIYSVTVTLILMLLLSISQSSFSATVTNLYSTKVAVTNNMTQAQAFGQGLQQVLLKVSSDATVLTNSFLQQQQNQAANFVEQYSAQTDTQGQNWLYVKFYSQPINQLLAQAHLAAWGSNRPQTLIWFVIQPQQQSSSFVHIQADNIYYQQIETALNQYAIPNIFPLYDLQDLNNITADNICHNQQTAILQASNRYNADAVLVGCAVQQSDKNWQLNLHLISSIKSYGWQFQNQDIHLLLQQGLQTAVTALANNYKINLSGTKQNSQEIILSVTNVKDFSTLNKVVSYLKHIAIVQDVQVNNVNEDSVSLSLTINGDINALQQQLSVDHALIPLNNNQQTTNNNNSNLVYRWIT